MGFIIRVTCFSVYITSCDSKGNYDYNGQTPKVWKTRKGAEEAKNRIRNNLFGQRTVEDLLIVEEI